MAIKLSLLAPRGLAGAGAIARARSVDAVAVRFDRALQNFEAGEWEQAFAELAGLADQGHPVAARIAVMLARRGSALFGGRFPASRERRARWQNYGDG